MIEKTTQAKRLEDCKPGATRNQVLGALNKVSKSNGEGNGSHTEQKRTEEEVKIVANAVVEYNREAFKELERL